MLERNRQRVQQLTGWELWLFIVARVLVGFGVGVLAMVYFPQVAALLGWPAVVMGMVLFIVAAKGLLRKGKGGEGS